MYLCLSVTDTGVGMKPEIKTHLFEPFFTTRPSGAGLGLTVARHTLPRPADGSPRIPNPAWAPVSGPTFAAGTLPSPVADATEDGPGPSGQERILVVDDDPLAMSTAQRLLQRSGYTVWGAPGGEEALAFFRQHKDEIDLVLLDIVMPFVNGEDVYREIQNMKPGTRVLLVSGFTAKRLNA